MNELHSQTKTAEKPGASLRLLSIVGTRPQLIKLAPLVDAIAHYNQGRGQKEAIRHLILHTGQHYDDELSQIFFDELAIPAPDIQLGVGSGTHAQQTARMLIGIEGALLQYLPDLLILYGDTNSTLAGALAAAKLQLPIAHVEAGLRSFNRRMPEEINRITTDHLSDLLLAPTTAAAAHLKREGLAEKTVLTGDIMYDAVLRNVGLTNGSPSCLSSLGLDSNRYYLATVHRAENTDQPEVLQAILDQLNELAANHYPIVFPMHPRTTQRWKELLPDWTARPELLIIPSVGYLDMLSLTQHARLVLTDSGGLQKEAFFLNCPCITLREETEWVETIESGGNILTGANVEKIAQAVHHWERRLERGVPDFSKRAHHYYGSGDAAQKILGAVLQFLESPLYS